MPAATRSIKNRKGDWRFTLSGVWETGVPARPPLGLVFTGETALDGKLRGLVLRRIARLTGDARKCRTRKFAAWIRDRSVLTRMSVMKSSAARLWLLEPLRVNHASVGEGFRTGRA